MIQAALYLASQPFYELFAFGAFSTTFIIYLLE